MGDFLRSAFAALPTVATHPLAFVGYIVVVLAWLIIAWRVRRNKNLLEHLDKLPKGDRLKALEIEIGHVPVREGLSPEQYLRSRIHLFYFLGFSILCLMIVTIFVISAVTGHKKEGTANADVSLYEDEEDSNRQPEFVPDSKGQQAGVAVVEREVTDYAKRRYGDDILRYVYDRIAENKIHIKPEMPYLSLLHQEGPITDYPGCLFNYPKLSVKVVNNTDRTILITEVALNVKSSKVYTLPIISIVGSDRAPAHLYIENEGWGDLINPVIRYDITDEDSCENVNFADTKYVEHLPTIRTETKIDISHQIPPELAQKAHKQGILPSVCVFGQVSYGLEGGRVRTATFKAHPIIVQVSYHKIFPSYRYNLILEAGKEKYVKRITVSHELKPGAADLFLLQVASDRWAQFDLDFSFRTTEGNYLPGNEVLLDIFVPRSAAPFIYLDPNKK